MVKALAEMETFRVVVVAAAVVGAIVTFPKPPKVRKGAPFATSVAGF